MISSIVRGNDFSMEINVVTPQYEETGTIWLDFNITECTNVAVNLICTKDQVVIPLKWHIKEDTTNVIIADVEGKYLHSGAVYALEITGLDAEEKAWRFKNKAVFSIVDDTAHSKMQASLMADPLEVNAEIGLTVHVLPVPGPQGPQGPQGEKGQDGPQGEKGEDGTVSFDELTPEQKEELRGPQGFTGAQGPKGEQGEKGQDGSVSFDDLTPEQKEELRGPQGVQGPQGERGQDGAQGLDGAQGPQGERGAQGEKGDTGVQGPKGEQGDRGIDGVQGPQGERGAQGEKGDTGVQGPQGDIGPQGPQGQAGSDATVDPVNIVIDEQMPANPDEGAVYMIQKPISIIPSFDINSALVDLEYNKLTINCILYDSLENKHYADLKEYADYNNINITVDNPTSGTINIKFNNKTAFYLYIQGISYGIQSVSIDNGKIVVLYTYISQSEADRLFIDAYYISKYWMNDTSYYGFAFSPYGMIRYTANIYGLQGPQGAQGSAGPQGPQGSDGPQGPQGSDGPQGPQGERGSQGPAGSSANSGFNIVTNPSDSTKKGVVSARAIYYDTNIGNGATIEGNGTNATNPNVASGNNSHVEGQRNQATNNYAHAEGNFTIASGAGSHTEGDNTQASGSSAHAEGSYSNASSSYAHAEGYHTTASSNGSHAEGYYAKAQANYSHAEGYYTKTIQKYAHAEGEYSEANGQSSMCCGFQSRTKNKTEVALGFFNNSTLYSATSYDNTNATGTLFSIGNGTSNTSRHNAFEVKMNGDIYLNDGSHPISSTTNGLKIELVASMPASPDANTLYVVV